MTMISLCGVCDHESRFDECAGREKGTGPHRFPVLTTVCENIGSWGVIDQSDDPIGGNFQGNRQVEIK